MAGGLDGEAWVFERRRHSLIRVSGPGVRGAEDAESLLDNRVRTVSCSSEGATVGSGRKKCWSYIAGERGRNWVRAFGKQRGGILFVERYEQVPGRTKPRRKRASLGYRDRTKAKNMADVIASACARKEVSEPLKGEPGDSVDDRVGSIEVGKDADLVVWEGDPLGTRGETRVVVVDGRVVFRR